MPGDPRRYPNSGRRSLVDYARFQDRKGEYTLVCVNRGILDLIRILVIGRAYWPTTYVDSYNVGSYTPISATELDTNIEPFLAEFLETTEEMNCDDLITKLTDIATAITAASVANEGCCGGGSAGSSHDEQDADTFTDDHSTTFPVGYADRAAYEDGKCQAALRILEKMETDLAYLKASTILTLTASALVGALLLPVPGANIILIVGFVSALIVQGTIVATANEVIDWIDDERLNILCRLYAADDATEAMADFDDDSMSATATLLLAHLLSFDVLNELFTYTEVGDYSGDCSGCDCEWEVTFGTGTIQTDGTEFTMTAEWDGVNSYDIDLTLSNTCCQDRWELTVVAVRGSPNNGCLVQCCPGPTSCQTGPTLPVDDWQDVTRVSQVDSTVTDFEIDFTLERLAP